MRALRSTLPLLLALLLLAPATAFAHKVNIFAYVDGKNIVADCFFSKNDRVHQGAVTITDATTGAVLGTGTTDDKGSFVVPVPKQAIASGHSLKLLLKAGEGHQTETVVEASEFASLTAAAKQAPAKAAATAAPAASGKVKAVGKSDKTEAKRQANPPAKASGSAQAAPAEASTAPATTPMDEAELTRIVNQAVQAQVAPLKAMIAGSVEKGPGPSEIAGGIGYIVGLFGVIAFAASRRRGGSGK